MSTSAASLTIFTRTAEAQTSTGYVPLTPARILDTRTNVGAPGPVGPGGSITVDVTGVGGVPESGVGAVVLNVTATNPTEPTYVTVWPSGQARPEASNLNVVAGESVPNLVIATVGAGGTIEMFNFAGSVDLVADVTGWLPAAAPFTQYTALTPARILDSRSLLGAGGWVGEGGQITVDVTGVGGVPETGVAAVVLNVTATNPTEPTYVTVWPTGQPRPEASNLNVVAGESRPNLVIARVGDGGTVDMYNFNGQVDLVADVAGWFPASADYIGLTPSRVLDTRSNAGAAGPVQPGGSITVDVTGVGGVPETGVGAVVLNVTATNPTEPTFVTVWPSGQARPEASNLNVMAGESVPNLVIATVGAGGTIEMFNYAGSVDLVADVAGWFPAPSGPPEPPPPPGPGDPQPPAGSRVEMKVLVVDDGGGQVSSIANRLRLEGVPYQVINLADPGRQQLTAAFLSSTVNGQRRAHFNGVVLPDESPSALSLAEMNALHAFEDEFAIRQVDAFVVPSAAVGLNTTQWSGALDGASTTVTGAGLTSAYKYMDGPLAFENLSATIDESYGYLSAPAPGAALTPLLTAPIPGTSAQGSLIGALHTGNREELVLTFGYLDVQPKFQYLAHGIVSWLTKGAYAGLARNYFAVHIDDIFLPDDRWHTVDNCTFGDGCPPTSTPIPRIRMVPADVDVLLQWQATNGLYLDMLFNGVGPSEEPGGDGEPLTARLLQVKDQLRWANHTFNHTYLGCTQNPDNTCVQPVNWMDQGTIQSEISLNISWAAAHGIAINPTELVTGEHSGLRSPPQVPDDNPNFGPALAATGIGWVGADNSRDSTPRQVGSAFTVPRFPMNIFYNVATKAEAIDEYNWIYLPAPNGICVPSGINTCLTAPLTVAEFDTVLVPQEAGIALTHMMGNNPRPHYAHQSNITEERILYPVLNRILTDYRAVFADNTPVANPTTSQSGTILRRQALWEAAVQSGGVESYVQSGHLIVINRTGGNLDVPVTAPNGSKVGSAAGSDFGEAYAGERSAFQTLAPGASITVVVP